MKKLFAILLAVILVMASTVALAADEPTYEASASESIKLNKTYEVTDLNSNAAVFPSETITFAVTEDSGNPTGQTSLTVADVTVTDPTDNEITITIPSYTMPGVYKYTVTETPPTEKTQGVEYDEATLEVIVLVGFKADQGNKLFVLDKAAYIKKNEEKVDEFTNTFKLGGLKVTKEVAGNLGDTTKKFPINITLSATDTVRNAITYTIGTTEETINAEWTGDKVITVNLAHNETVEFKEIPLGVTYKVEEDAAISHVDSADDEYNNADAYKVTGEVTTAVEIDSTTEAKEETITNTKNFEIPEGIGLDVLPYVMIMVIALAGAALLVVRRRKEQF
ncbi:MAG: hypothetical protein K5663_12885 [Clostridiales bacterium]|nr:hypothetical protein [Clostridiales bacterium]